jgi:hypothetical protein
MAIMDLGNVDQQLVEAPARRSMRPPWRTSPVPWIVTGALGLALVIGGIVTYSIRTAGTVNDQQRAGLIQTCLEMGGTAQQCGGVASGQAAGNTDSAADDSALDSIAS